VRIRALFTALAMAACCLLFSLIVAQGAASAAPSAATCERPRGPLVAYGHSYLSSPKIGGAPASYVTVAATSFGVKPAIRAVDEATTLDVDRMVHQGPTRWVPGSSDLVLIDSSINDIEKQIPTAQWTAALRHTLTAFVPRPVPTILLVRPLPVRAPGHPGHNPEVIEHYAAAQRAVAAQFSAVRIVDASAGWSPSLDVAGDGIHPTRSGVAHLARAIQGTARRVFCQQSTQRPALNPAPRSPHDRHSITTQSPADLSARRPSGV